MTLFADSCVGAREETVTRLLQRSAGGGMSIVTELWLLSVYLVVVGYSVYAVVLLHYSFCYHSHYTLLIMLGMVGFITPLEVLTASLRVD